MHEGYSSRSVMELAAAYPVCWKLGAIRFSVLLSTYVSCGFRWKRFLQKFWRDLLITSAFFAFWTLDGQKTQPWLLFKKTSMIGHNSADLPLGTVDYHKGSWLSSLQNCWSGTHGHVCTSCITCIAHTSAVYVRVHVICNCLQLHMRILVVTL